MTMKRFLSITGILGGAWVMTMLVYWFNLDNKMIYYGVRPMLNWLYDRQERDVKL